MYCKYCGEKNDDDARFCCKCGKNIDDSGQIMVSVSEQNNEQSGTQSDMTCPYCGGKNLRRDERAGCLSFLGELVFLVIIYWILLAINIEGLTNLYAKLCPFVIIASIIYCIYDKSKPNWVWKMYCNDCNKEFEYDSFMKKYIKKD